MDVTGSAMISAVAGLAGAFFGGLFQSRAAIRAAITNAEAARMTAETAAKTADNSERRKQKDAQRQATRELCNLQTERLEKFKSDLAELISIAYSRDETGSQPLDESKRQRAFLLTSQLLISPFPVSPVGMHLSSDIDKLHSNFLGPESGTVANSALWSRYILNAMTLVGRPVPAEVDWHWD